MLTFEGIYTPAITPYAADGSIDFTRFSEVLESLIEGRVHGIIIGGSTGEYYAQSPEERKALAEHARQVIGNRLPLIVGTGAIRTEDAVDYAKHAREIKADAILVTSPPYALPTELENAHHALTVDKAAQLPIMLYNYPGRMGITMGETYFREVSRSSNIVAIKESSGISITCTCWPANSRTLRSPAAGTTRRWSSLHGARAAGCVPAPTLFHVNTWRCMKPAWWKKTSKKGARSWPP